VLTFEVDDFDAAASRLAQYGAIADGQVQEDALVKIAAFRAVDGVMLSLVQHKLPANASTASLANERGLQIGDMGDSTSIRNDSEEEKEKARTREEIKQMLRNIKL
jgi:hypothetical protein